MTRELTSASLEQVSRVVSSRERRAYVDVFRGLLIAHMGLDHASLMFNAGRGAEELASAAPATGDVFQFLTRFTGVPVAPAFFFMAGFMVALTSAGRSERGVSQADITRRLIIRGLVLIGVDAVIMGLPRALMGFYSFMVLTSIGVALIALALLRHLPPMVLLPIAVAILLLHPLIDVSMLPVPLQAMLHEPVRTGVFRSLYPILPWSAVVFVGYIVGRDSLTRERLSRFWLTLSAICLLLFLLVRLGAGYGNAYEYEHVLSLEFWLFAKYPPDLAFLTWSFAIIFLMLPVLSRWTRAGVPTVLRPFEAYGRVPFFFYVVHFYVLGLAQAAIQQQFGLLATYGMWVMLLLVMLPLCVWYDRKKRERPNLITRYF